MKSLFACVLSGTSSRAQAAWPRATALGLVLTFVLGLTVPTFAKDKPAGASGREAELIAVLKSDGSRKAKADACRELARVGTKESVATLAGLLPDEELSHMARYALEPIPSPAVEAALRDALGKLHGRLLAGVITSLGVRKDAKAVSRIAGFLDDGDADVSRAAARALGQIGTRNAARALEKALPTVSADRQLALYEGLFRCAETLSDQGQRKVAIHIYDRLRGVATAHEVRTAALRGAILSRQKDGLPLLISSLGSSDFAVSQAAARISQEMQGPEVTQALISQLPAAPAGTQIVLLQTLGRRHDPAAVEAIGGIARAGDKSARIAALRALVELGNARSVPLFVQLIADADAEVAQAAKESLGGMPGSEADNAVLDLLKQNDANRQITAMDLIVRRRLVAATGSLAGLAEKSEPKLRVAAYKHLGELASPSDLPTLLRLLAAAGTPDDLEAAEQALNAVSARSSDVEDTAGKLVGALSQSPAGQKCALLRVLAALGGKQALKSVRSAVDESTPEVHAAALRALCGWNNADAAPDLLELAKSAPDSADKLLSLRGLIRLASQPDVDAAQRLALCRQASDLVQKDDEKRLLLAALGNIPLTDSLALIAPYLTEAGIREEAGTAALNVVDKLLQAKDASQTAEKTLNTLEKVAQIDSNADLVKRANSLLEKARAKAGAK